MLRVVLPCPVSCGHTPSFGMLVMMTFRISCDCLLGVETLVTKGEILVGVKGENEKEIFTVQHDGQYLWR